jgi:hypothetical protein
MPVDAIRVRFLSGRREPFSQPETVVGGGISLPALQTLREL